MDEAYNIGNSGATAVVGIGWMDGSAREFTENEISISISTFDLTFTRRVEQPPERSALRSFAWQSVGDAKRGSRVDEKGIGGFHNTITNADANRLAEGVGLEECGV